MSNSEHQSGGAVSWNSDIRLEWQLGLALWLCMLGVVILSLTRIHSYLQDIPDQVQIADFSASAFGPALAAGALGSSLRYMRRLYRDLFRTSESAVGVSSGEYRLAVIIYYVSRPTMAVAFAVFVVIGSAAGFLSLVSRDTPVDGRGVLFVALLSGLCGYAIGRIIDALDRTSIRLASAFEREVSEKLG